MSKTKASILMFLAFCLMIFACIPLASLSDVSASATDVAASAQSHENFTVDIGKRSGHESASLIETTYNNKKAYKCNWEDVNKFIFTVDASKDPPTSAESYNLSISITSYVKGYSDGELVIADTFIATDCITDSKTGSNSYTQFSSYELSIDTESSITSDDGSKFGGWGIYQFRLYINSKQTYSDYFIVEPTMAISDEVPKIDYEATTSSTSKSLIVYDFSLKNSEAYRFIDSATLTWHIDGISNNGVKYCLDATELERKEFKDTNYSTLYSAYSNSGTTFVFDDNSIGGEWTIWCEYLPKGANDAVISNSVVIKTGQEIKLITVLWVTLAVFALSIAITIGISLYKIKREKIY